MAYMTESAAPTDLIPIAEGEKLVGHSRQWMKNHVTVYRKAGRDWVSKSEVLEAKRAYDTPVPKDGKDDD